jgi:hypothetical protein
MKRLILTLLVFIGFTTGCTMYNIDSRDTTLDFYPPKQNISDVQYLETVDKPYVEIGLVTVTTERRQSLEDVLPMLKQEAAILGGDIITDIQTNASGSWEKIKANKLFGNAYLRANYTAKVLVLK